MIEINWGIFKAKFNGKEQSSFQWLCYLLFCKEFNQNIGISRYKNHAGIETDPIEINNEKVGWQAKFYDTRLSEHKEDFIASINTAKTRHPEINKIIFYTNQDFGQGKIKNDPQHKIDIENHAQAKKVKVEWRTASFFESSFVSADSETIAKYFFSLDKSIFNLIEVLKVHSENILNEVQDCIAFGSQNIEIDRSTELEKIKANSDRVLILSGAGGVGKTALVKNLYEQIKEKVPFYIFKATEFELRNINEFFTGYNFQDFLEAHKDENDKIIVIDSAEKLLGFENFDLSNAGK